MITPPLGSGEDEVIKSALPPEVSTVEARDPTVCAFASMLMTADNPATMKINEVCRIRNINTPLETDSFADEILILNYSAKDVRLPKISKNANITPTPIGNIIQTETPNPIGRVPKSAETLATSSA